MVSLNCPSPSTSVDEWLTWLLDQDKCAGLFVCVQSSFGMDVSLPYRSLSYWIVQPTARFEAIAAQASNWQFIRAKIVELFVEFSTINIA